LKRLAATFAALSLIASTSAQADQTKAAPGSPTLEQVQTVAPALAKYARGPLAELWKRPGLAPRDRSIVTLAALIARNQTIEMPRHLNLALDNRVKPREISEIITHLAFYSGWANAMAAVAVASDVFAAGKIGPDQLPDASPTPLAIDQAWETQRERRVGEQFGARPWSRTRPTCCSATCGCAPTLRRAPFCHSKRFVMV
jgi:4-carboxymuconolactone decarboxylase